MFKKYFTYSLVIFFAYSLFQTLIIFSFASIFNVDISNSESLSNGDLTGFTILLSAIVGVIMLLNACKRLGIDLKNSFDIKPFKLWPLIISIIVFLCFFGLMNLLSGYFPSLEDDFAENLIKSSHYPVLLLLGIGIAGPIFEELFFRGLLINTFNTLNKGVHFSVMITSILFALVHGQYNLTVMLAIIPFGLILGYSRIYSKSIIPAIIVHVLNNSITLISFYL